MPHKDDRKNKRRRGKHAPPDLTMPAGGPQAREKQKARDLRASSWWRKKRAAGICYYCGKKFPPDDLTMDHLIPLSRGGSSERFNIVPACKECNNRKKYLLPAEWDEYIEMIKNKG
jgi:5-methylcytosine-specific restriction endonuclease McrA